MAYISIHVGRGRHAVIDSFVGSRLSDSEMRKYYGKDFREYYSAVYYIKKPNRFGVTWVSVSPRGTVDCSTDARRAKEPLKLLDNYKITIS